MKNVLYISYDGMTDPLGQSQVIPYLIGLTKKGYSFTILSCEKEKNYYNYRSRINKILKMAGIDWEPIFYTKRPPILSTIYDIIKLKQTALKLNKARKFDFIHCRSYITSLVGLSMVKKYNLPFVFDMRGFWADERVDGNLWNLNNPVYKLVYKYFKKKEIEFLNYSSAVVCLTEAAKHEMSKWNNLKFNLDKIKIIPCCADTELFNPDEILVNEQNELRKSLQIKNDDFLMGYLGSIGTWYMVNEMIDFFKELKKSVPKARLLFVSHDDPEAVKIKITNQGVNLNDVIITNAVREKVPVMISLFKYGLFFIKPVYSKIASSPTKQGEIMAMGVPIVCNAGVGDTDYIVNRYDSGLIVNNGNYKSVIEKVIENKIDRNKIRAGAIDFFSLTKGVEKYYEVYSSL